MARTTPRIEQNILVLPVDKSAQMPVGSQQWYSWLADEENGSFFFTNEMGSFTARKECRRRGGWYWITHRSRGGRLAKAYIGRGEDLTPERLHAVTYQLSSQGVHHGGPLCLRSQSLQHYSSRQLAGTNNREWSKRLLCALKRPGATFTRTS